METSLQQLITLLQSLEFGPWAATAVVSLFFLESAPVTGLLLPGIFLAVGLGSISNTNYISFTDALLYASLGALLGDSLGYWIGYLGNKKGIIARSIQTQRQKHLKIAQLIKHYGVFAVFVGRFIWFLHPLVPLAAGISRIKPALFYLADTPAVLLWILLYSAFGHFVTGLARSSIIEFSIATGIVSTLALIIVIYRHLNKKSH